MIRHLCNNADLNRNYYLKEQLKLFAFDVSLPVSPELAKKVNIGLSKRERIATLLEGELNFHGEKSDYASHDLHAFAAKFPPQLPRAFIRGLTDPGDYILDPMLGSGTSIVEALLEDRTGIGLDIDPLALMLSQVKTTPLDAGSLNIAGTNVISRSTDLMNNQELLDNEIARRFDDKTREFVNYWFFPSTQREIIALTLSIEEVEEFTTRHFLALTLSSIIITKSGGVSRARDLAHSRPHLDKTKVPKSAIYQFSTKLRKNLASISYINHGNSDAFVIAGDTRIIPLASESMDLIVTSPPYANAIDYMRAHKFSLVWFGEAINDLSELRAKYIGSERVGKSSYSMLPFRVEEIINSLEKNDSNKAAILRKYFIEMKEALKEMHRVLKNDCPAIIVVGTSTMRGLDIQTHLCLADIGADIGFEVVGVVQRIMDRNKRMMPARFGKKSNSVIEQRMHEEYVLGLLKNS